MSFVPRRNSGPTGRLGATTFADASSPMERSTDSSGRFGHIARWSTQTGNGCGHTAEQHPLVNVAGCASPNRETKGEDVDGSLCLGRTPGLNGWREIAQAQVPDTMQQPETCPSVEASTNGIGRLCREPRTDAVARPVL